jgi:predicted DNA-binding protein with PD1-like motif
MQPKNEAVESFAWHIWEQHEGHQRFRSAAGRPGRIISGRLLPGCDLLRGIVEMARSHNVQAAWVNGFGSLAKATFSPGIRRSAADSDRVERTPNVHLDGPIEMWSGMGRLSLANPDEPIVHFHGMVVTQEGQLYGGHFFPGGNPIYATFETHIQEVLDVAFRLEMDNALQFAVLEPKGEKKS